MQQYRASMLKLTVCTGLMAALAGCGGGDAGAPSDRLAAERLTPPTVPAEQPATLDTAPFVKMALEGGCTDRHNRLYVIDRTYVFWNSAGNCADASYSFRLYKLNVDNKLCSHGDSIAGPRTTCADEQQRALFDSLVKNAEASNLGLDASHTVEKVDLGNHPHPWTDIDRRQFSRAPLERNLVIQDAEQWIALWNQHAPGEPVPKIDFTGKMVIAVFGAGGPNQCYHTAVTAMTLDSGKLVVVRTDTSPGNAKIACLAALSFPAHIVAIDRVDVPVEFVVKQGTL